MKNSKFCHLHVHGEHSYLDGLGTVKQLTARAKELGFTHLAYTNHGNIDGLIQFQKKCDEIGLNPVLGCELYIVPKMLEKNKDEKRGHIIILVKNQSGWQSLCNIITKANLEGFYHRPRIDYDSLLSCDLSGLVILTACIKSFVYLPMGEAFLWSLVEQTKDVYVEIMPHCNLDGIAEHNKRLSELRMKYGLKFVATNDVHYVNKDDCKTHDVLLAMQSKAKMTDSDRWKFDERGLYLKTANEMLVAFGRQKFFDRPTIISAIKNSIKIAEKCESFRIPKYQISLPPILKHSDDDTYLEELCFKSPLFLQGERHLKRLKFELNIIKQKKFSRYFLVVRDLVRWCKKNNILVGCGRGSVGGSLCAYLLGITTINPLKYGLLFSRFINKDRIDFPDIDLDFEHNKRGLVINYLKEKYGENRIAGVSTFLTMQGKAVVRDVARVYDVPLKEVNEFTKAIFVDSESESSLKDSLSTFEGKRFQKQYPDVIEHALKLEGQIKSCVDGNSRVLVYNEKYPLYPKIKKIKALWKEKFRGKIRSYDFKNGIFFFDDIKQIYYTGIKKTIKVKVGKSIFLKLTRDHKILTRKGWKEARHLQIGDFVATNGKKQVPWNKGLKNVQVPWNKGLTKDDHFSIQEASERWKENNPSKTEDRKRKISIRSFRHGLYSKQTMTLLEKYPICQKCKEAKSHQKHHLDKNRKNNKAENLIAVCISCHNKFHPKPNRPKINGNLVVKFRKITGIKYGGKKEVYDIQMRSKNHNFVCNKIVVHNCGQHAAAVVISPKDLHSSDRGNLCSRGNAENKSVVVNWEMSDAEYVGLMKLDVLGLNTLTILNEAMSLITNKFNYSSLDPSDKKVFEMLSKGDTVGIFQMSTPMMTDMVKKIGISSFNDMVASLALVRPGPLESGMTEDYINRKNGGSWEKKHPVYEKITKDTYGATIYQEQVMQVINRVAGLSYSTADEIRKVIGKKRHSSEFEPYRVKFLEGCKETKIFSEKEAKWFWEMILKCARYLFNKSHAVEYAMLSYWTAWTKLYYPHEFITACLTCGSEDKKDEYIREARKMEIVIMPPKVKYSDAFKWKMKNKIIYAPFIEVKGIGEKAIEKIKNFEKCNMGFFGSEQKLQGRVGEMLSAVDAYNPTSIPSDLGKYFAFDIGSPVSIKEISFKNYANNKKLGKCHCCSLRKECKRPVNPSFGKYNVAIVGDSPGKEDDLKGIPFSGKTGKVLFDAIEKYRGKRSWFHITNVAKCFPSISKTIEKEHVNACSEWIKDELSQIQCSLILSLGAKSLYAFTGQEGGIMNANGKLEYNNTYKCMIMYCIHPAAVLRDPDKEEMFNSTIKSFVDLVKRGIN